MRKTGKPKKLKKSNCKKKIDKNFKKTSRFDFDFISLKSKKPNQT